MKKTKKIVIILLSVLLLAFLILNIVWFSFYFSMKDKFAGVMEIMERAEDLDGVHSKAYVTQSVSGNKYDKENYTNNYRYHLHMPKYLSFSCYINVAGGYNLEEDEDGVKKYTEDYGIISDFTYKPFGEYSYRLDIVCCNDENGEARKEFLNVPVFIDKNKKILSEEEIENIDDGGIVSFYEMIGVTFDEVEELYYNKASEYVNSMCDSMEKHYGDWLFEN